MTVSIKPSDCVSYSYTKIETKLGNGPWIERTTSLTDRSQQSHTYSASPNEVYSARVTTYNQDGYYEAITTSSNVTIPALIDDSYTVPAFAGSGYHAAVAEVKAVAAVTGVTEVLAVTGVTEVAAVAGQSYIAPSWGGDTWGNWDSLTHIMLNGSATGSKYTPYTNNSTQQPNGIQARNLTYNGAVSQVSNGGSGATRAVCYVVDGTRYFVGALSQGADAPVQTISRGTGGNWGMGCTGTGFATNNTSGESGSAWYYCDVRIRYQYYDGGQPYIAAVAYVAPVTAVAYVAPVTAVAAVSYIAPVAAYWDSPPYASYIVTRSY